MSYSSAFALGSVYFMLTPFGGLIVACFYISDFLGVLGVVGGSTLIAGAGLGVGVFYRDYYVVGYLFDLANDSSYSEGNCP